MTNDKDSRKDNSLELNVIDLFPLLFKYKYISLFLLITPILFSMYYIMSRESNFVAEIIVEESKIIMPSIMLIDNEIKWASNLSYENSRIKGFVKSDKDLSTSIGSKRLYHSYIHLLQEINSEDIKNFKIGTNSEFALLPSNIIIEKEKKLNKATVLIRYPEKHTIRKVLGILLAEADLVNKQLIYNDLVEKRKYIEILKRDARERHIEEILFSEERIKNKIDYVKELQKEKLDKAKTIISENLELARISGIDEPLIPVLESFVEKDSVDYVENLIQTPSSGGEYSNIIDSGIPLFYFGVNILENELKIINNRKNNDLLTPGLAELKAELENVITQEGDAFIVFLEYLNDLDKLMEGQVTLMNELVENKNIKTVNYNLDKIKVDKGSFSGFIIILVATIIGFIFSSIVALIRESLKKVSKI